MKNSLLLILVGLLLTATGCIKKSGPVITELRHPGKFESIALMSAADIFITQDKEYSVKIEAGENHMKYIETEVVNGVLEIDELRNRVWSDNRVRVWVSVDYLEDISLLGSGDIEGSGFEAGELKVKIAGSGDIDLSFTNEPGAVIASIAGSGDIELAGDAGELNLTIAGSGDFNGDMLFTEDAMVNISGSGDAHVWATNSLTVHIAGSGDVHYRGDPDVIDVTVSGSGDVIEH